MAPTRPTKTKVVIKHTASSSARQKPFKAYVPPGTKNPSSRNYGRVFSDGILISRCVTSGSTRPIKAFSVFSDRSAVGAPVSTAVDSSSGVLGPKSTLKVSTPGNTVPAPIRDDVEVVPSVTPVGTPLHGRSPVDTLSTTPAGPPPIRSTTPTGSPPQATTCTSSSTPVQSVGISISIKDKRGSQEAVDVITNNLDATHLETENKVKTEIGISKLDVTAFKNKIEKAKGRLRFVPVIPSKSNIDEGGIGKERKTKSVSFANAGPTIMILKQDKVDRYTTPIRPRRAQIHYTPNFEVDSVQGDGNTIASPHSMETVVVVGQGVGQIKYTAGNVEKDEAAGDTGVEYGVGGRLDNGEDNENGGIENPDLNPDFVKVNFSGSGLTNAVGNTQRIPICPPRIFQQSSRYAITSETPGTPSPTPLIYPTLEIASPFGGIILGMGNGDDNGPDLDPDASSLPASGTNLETYDGTSAHTADADPTAHANTSYIELETGLGCESGTIQPVNDDLESHTDTESGSDSDSDDLFI